MNASRTATLQIATPEGVAFSLPLAGPFTRAMAFSIDFVAIMAAMNVIAPILRAMQLLGGDTGMGVAILIQFVCMEGARMAMELFWRGQTLGKRVMGLRVMDESGLKLRPSQVVVRNLLRFVDMLPMFYALGGVVALFNSRSQRLGDLAAGTVVVRTIKTTPPDVAAVLAGKYNSLRDHPHLEARLRQKVGPEEAQVALNALVRREELTPEAKITLFENLANHFRELVKFPEETVHGLSDEQYVRNVVETIFRRRKGAD
ncbi:RDD family protein [Verrucomicrobium sp. BvORR106]|uniref:RDD family protein n=1 Tax=Verrucomicrobium sp. BvORR106 TaxID=1403819 RepID=UPI00056F937B|nr:RDD family protein [Verrucomicrobium sp. BvORR106]